jgi:hypothetical protein
VQIEEGGLPVGLTSASEFSGSEGEASVDHQMTLNSQNLLGAIVAWLQNEVLWLIFNKSIGGEV